MKAEPSKKGCLFTIGIGLVVGIFVALNAHSSNTPNADVLSQPTSIPPINLSASVAQQPLDITLTPLPIVANVVESSVTEEMEPIIYPTELTPTPSSTPYPIWTLTPIPDPMDIPADTYLVIPSVDVQAQIVRVYVGEGTWDVRQLGMKIGYLEGTTPPGKNGNVVLAGHVEMADGRKGVFSTLKQVMIGAEVLVIREGKTIRYAVSSVSETTPTNLEPIQPTEDDRITLITCDDLDFTNLSYKNRIIVVAERVD